MAKSQISQFEVLLMSWQTQLCVRPLMLEGKTIIVIFCLYFSVAVAKAVATKSMLLSCTKRLEFVFCCEENKPRKQKDRMPLAGIVEFFPRWLWWGNVSGSLFHLLRALRVAGFVHEPSTCREVPRLWIATCWRKQIHCQKNVLSAPLWFWWQEQWKLVSQQGNVAFPCNQSVVSAADYLRTCLKSSTCSVVACFLLVSLWSAQKAFLVCLSHISVFRNVFWASYMTCKVCPCCHVFFLLTCSAMCLSGPHLFGDICDTLSPSCLAALCCVKRCVES